MSQIGLILGSARKPSNTSGIVQWLTKLSAKTSLSTSTLRAISPHDAIYPNLLEDSAVPQAVLPPDAPQYNGTKTREWSTFVSSSEAIIVVTPQYNWGYPGALKNAIDHLFHEWKGKPILLVTFGGHGGAKCAEQLTSVFEGGCKAKVVGRVEITLPRPYIGGNLRVGLNEIDLTGKDSEKKIDGEVKDEFLKEYEGKMKEELEKLAEVLKVKK